MTPKERVLAIFRHERPDRLPIDFSANPGIIARLTERLKTPDYESLLRALSVDFRPIGAPYSGKLLFPELPGRIVDPVYGFYMRWAANESGGYYDYCDFPLAGAEGERLAEYPLPSPDDFDYSLVTSYSRAHKEYALHVGNPGFADVINSTGRMMGMEDALVGLSLGEEGLLRYIERRAEMELGILERTIEAAEGNAAFLFMGEDLGTQVGPMVSLDLYRSVLRPIHQKFIDLADSYGLPVLMHTCGSSSWAYEDFIEMGIKAVDTLQPEAKHMDPEYLNEKFGSRLAFHGCISTAGALAYGTPEEVEETVKRTVSVFHGDCNYMIAPTHMIQDNSPTENVLKMYECALKYGKY